MSQWALLNLVLLDSTVDFHAAFQEYETLPEEGTRAEQLAKQQRNLKQRSVVPKKCYIADILCRVVKNSTRHQRFRKSDGLDCMQTGIGWKDGGSDGHQ